MKATQVHEKLVGIVDTVSKRGDTFTARRGFFYTHGNSSDKIAAAIQRLIPGAVIVDHEEIWKSFRGGAELRNSSHFCVKFRIEFKVIGPQVAACVA